MTALRVGPQRRHPSDVPPGYPAEYERELRLSDGRTILIRPIVPADAPLLAEAIRTADVDTLRRRFLGGPPSLTAASLAKLSTVDYRRRFALVATGAACGNGAAVARYEQLAEGVAEIAVVVHPAWRRVGLATMLIEMLAEAALERGIHTFNALYLADNRPVTALLELAGDAGRQEIKNGMAEFTVELDRASVAAAIWEAASCRGEEIRSP